MMVAMAGIVVVQYTDDSAADSLGTYDQKINVYYFDGVWKISQQSSYNLYQAIDAAATATGLTPVTASGNDSWVSGYDPNKTYGEITKFTKVEGEGDDMEIIDVTDYTIMAWDGSAWQNVTSAPLGWIRPHADYGERVVIPGLGFSASANVAIVLTGQNVNTISANTLQAFQTVEGNNNTLYRFTLHDAVGTLDFEDVEVQVIDNSGNVSTITIDASDIQGSTGFVTVAGFGTDAYLALIDALGDNLISDNIVSTTDDRIYAWVGHNVYDPDTGAYLYSYDTYYSWMGSVFGVGTHSVPNGDGVTYYYWASLSGSYLNYSFGYYSLLPGAYNNVGSVFQLTYMFS
jgi:hypothetical protein